MFSEQRWPALAAALSRLDVPVVIVDLESTGGNTLSDRITEIAWLRFDNGPISHYEQLVNPQQPISTFITRLTGISDDMVVDAPTFSMLAPALLKQLQGALVVAHNSRFDYTFLKHEFARVGHAFAAPALCTVQLSRKLYPQFFKHNLDSIIERNGMTVENRHRAMTDVLVLADFLEKSLAEKCEEEWLNQSELLMMPKILPNWLPETLRQDLYRLSDRFGVLVWFDDNNQAIYAAAHEKTFSEVAEQLNKQNVPMYLRSASKVEFFPALGRLHATWLKAQIFEQHRFCLPQGTKTYLTIKFAADEMGELQAKVIPLENGIHAVQPKGLFLHKKAAKRAVLAWANEHRLCPAALDVLPITPPAGEACPVQASGLCDGECHTVSGKQNQAQKIIDMGHLLPVTDWGQAHEVEVTETDALSGEKMVFHCVGGALALQSGYWYFDDTLPALLKSKFKLGAQVVKVLS